MRARVLLAFWRFDWFDYWGLDCAIAQGWLEIHESGTFVKLTQGGADLFA